MQIEQSTARFDATGAPGWAMRFRRAVAWFRRIWAGRAAWRQMTEMEDWELSDIGLSREDIRSLRDYSPLEDPTRLLNEMVRAREKQISRRTA